MKLYKRQGDVLIFKVDKIALSLKEKNNIVIAEGEVTGHRHILVADKPETKIRIANDGRGFYLEILNDTATIKHEQHSPITLKPGKFFIKIQREYDPIVYQRKVKD